MAGNLTDRRVVVTGLGVVTPLGHDLETFWKNLISGQCGIDRITAFDAAAFDTQIAGEVRNFDPAPAFPSPKEVRRTDRYSQFGVYAALVRAQGFRRGPRQAGTATKSASSSAPASADSKPPPRSTKFCSSAARAGSRRS